MTNPIPSFWDSNNLPTESLYLVALSGGADSVALLLMMHQAGLHVGALHCNFHLRGEESDRDQNFVQELCSRYKIELQVRHFDTKEYSQSHGVSIEMAARDLRYQWFQEQVCQQHAHAICVAHHSDDQAETLLLNLIRGTGIRGLAGMSPVRKQGEMLILRPLLGISRQDILDFLHSESQDYVTDSTNMERDAMRNRIRLDIIPMLRQLNTSISRTLSNTAEIIRQELQGEQLSLLFHQLQPYGFNSAQVRDIHNHSNGPSGRIWESATHRLLLDRKEWILEQKSVISTTFSPGRCFVDADTLCGPLALRPVRTGDRFQPLGMTHGTKLVSDYLTDRKVNRFDKERQLVVTCSDQIVWIVGRDIDHRYRITPSTTHITELTVHN